VKVNNMGNSLHNDLFFATPGIRLQYLLQPRISVYGVVGGGYGSFSRFVPDDSLTSRVSAESSAHGVFTTGGGIDFRLNRRWSLRGELRDFISGKGLGAVEGRHHLVYLGGFAIHF